MKLTYQTIKDLGPCYDPVKYISKDWEGAVLDILRMTEVPAKDRLWVCVRRTLLTDRQLHLYGLTCARMSEKYSNDARVKQCNDVVERFLEGKATKAELEEAESAAGAARSAAWSAAWSAAGAARSAESAAGAARSAAWSAAGAESAAEQAQCEAIINILEMK